MFYKQHFVISDDNTDLLQRDFVAQLNSITLAVHRICLITVKGNMIIILFFVRRYTKNIQGKIFRGLPSVVMFEVKT